MSHYKLTFLDNKTAMYWSQLELDDLVSFFKESQFIQVDLSCPDVGKFVCGAGRTWYGTNSIMKIEDKTLSVASYEESKKIRRSIQERIWGYKFNLRMKLWIKLNNRRFSKEIMEKGIDCEVRHLRSALDKCIKYRCPRQQRR